MLAGVLLEALDGVPMSRAVVARVVQLGPAATPAVLGLVRGASSLEQLGEQLERWAAGSVGVGPGPGQTYYVDLPLASDTAVTLPVKAAALDFYDAIAPKLDAGAAALVQNIRAAVQQGVSEPIQQGLEAGSLIVERIDWTAIAFATFLGMLGGWGLAKAL